MNELNANKESSLEEINAIKYRNYKEQKKRLKKAIDNEFYIEALAIEYAIIEERTSAILEYAGISSISANGNPISLSRKLNMIKSKKPFTDGPLRKKIAVDIIERTANWKVQRDGIMHGLLVRISDTESFMNLAKEGLEVIREINNASGRVSRYCANSNKRG